MSRSVKKGPYVDHNLQEKVDKQNRAGTRNPIQTWARASTITPDFVGHTLMVHNGRTFLKCYVSEDMVGHKVGEFAPTRTFRGHASKKDK